MKKIVFISLLLVAILGLTSCSESDAPLNESQQAEQFNMSVTEYKETKDAAARMNMTVEDHMKMTDTQMKEMDSMDMSDDSDMIEDDMDMSNEKDDDAMHMEKMHKDTDVETHGSDEHM
jgi:hypothetical protein